MKHMPDSIEARIVVGHIHETRHHPLPIHAPTRSTVSPAPPHFPALRTARFNLYDLLPTRAVYRASGCFPHSGHNDPAASPARS